MHYFKAKLAINIITQLICFLLFAMFMNQLSFMYLMIIATLLITALCCIRAQHFFKMIKRMKWFFFAMLLIFTLNTPGEHIHGWNYFFSPTYEGVASGLLQIFRMLVLLAALSLVMAINTKQQLISGFYFLLLPLKCLGLETERFAARLCLTLDYVESAQQLNKRESFLEQLKAFGNPYIVQPEGISITFKMPAFEKLDVFVLCSITLVGVYASVNIFI